MQRFKGLSRNLAQSEDELAIFTMLLDDYYQQSLHTPPAQPTAEEAEEGGAAVPKPKPTPMPQSPNKRPRSRIRREKR
jgi:ATP-dependent RNA helicase DeaD